MTTGEVLLYKFQIGGTMDNILIEERKRMLLELMGDEGYLPMKLKELRSLLQVPRKEKGELRQALEDLRGEGKITIDNQGRYSISDENIKEGIFSGTMRGFGFVIIEDEEEDIFIPEDSVGGALHDDKVLVSIKEEKTGKRKEGEIIKIIERANKIVVGTFQKSNNFGFVITDNKKFGKDIYIAKEDDKSAVTGHKVVVEIKNYGNKDHNPEGKIIEVLGHIDDPGVDIMSIVKDNDLPVEFSEDVKKQLEYIPDEVDESEKDGRKDLRHLTMVTIDGADAKDLDDAISISKENNIYHLGVHIADVSHYVGENSPLDKEALKRGNSVYLVDRVIPMIPHQLSNGICSLNEGADRLALSCLMDIDEKGNVISHEIAETLIRVDKRMTYNGVKLILEDNNLENSYEDGEQIEEYKDFLPNLKLMEELARILRKVRHDRGSLDFDFPESKIILDETGFPIEVKAYERSVATKIIEEFMLIANETVAEDYYWQEIPFMYRTHEKPDEEKITQLGIFINNFGYSINKGKGDIHPKEIQKLLNSIDDKPEEALISRLTLRSLKRARYTTFSAGHFGLAAKYYSHFTAPIRRYSDLQIHRIIKENLNGNMGEKRIKHYEKILDEVAYHVSSTERLADDIEREVEKMKKVEYMSQFIGEEFEGVISGITNWGVYVELPNTVEGMIRIEDIDDDYYVYDEERYILVGERTGKTYKLGEKIKVQLVATDKVQRTIDFHVI